MSSNNGTHEAMKEAEREALDAQDAHPPVIQPPPAAAPAEPALYSPEWFAAQIAIHQAIAEQMLAQVTATDLYQRYMRQAGKLETLRELQQMGSANG